MSSDSSDSDAPVKPAPASATAKPKKKKRLSPQDAINRIWERFSVKEFSNVTVVLPSSSITEPTIDPSKPPDAEQNNLLVSEDYERAVQECRTRVRKLVKECQRVNMRYRDPDFDIDWDLRMRRGHCLNNLKDRKFNVHEKYSETHFTAPKSVKRVHEIFENPTFLTGEPSPSDVKQGRLGNCWLVAGLTALANVENGLKRICVEHDTKIGIYGFVFHRDGEWIISIIDDKLYLKSPDWNVASWHRSLIKDINHEDNEAVYKKTYQTGSQALFFGHCRDQNETWLPLVEKAYAKAHGDYASLVGGWIGEGLEDLTGGVTTELLASDILDVDYFWENEMLKVNKEFLFGCATGVWSGGYGERDGIVERHAYTVVDARVISTGERLVKLRNPWGSPRKGLWEGAWSDGSKEFTPEFQIEMNHQSGIDSSFWISYKDFLRKIDNIDRTRLFMDSPDWRITQKWVAIDVPWKSEYEQKFQIILRKESPVVLVLAQLDNRFFVGLDGQYRFELEFRLHEAGSPDDHDYIVRSHGNYLMSRSVVAELKSLAPGTYAVFVKVKASRYAHYRSVERVVKKQTKGRNENEKLAQVGMSYAIAHSKGKDFSKSKELTQKEHEKVKAREARIKLRKKNWEKRHLSRKIVRKQEKKNHEKRECSAAKVAAAEMAKKEAMPKAKAVQTEDVKEVVLAKSDKSVQTEDLTTSSTPENEKPALPVADDGTAQGAGGITDGGLETGDQPSQTQEQTSSPGPDSEKTAEAEISKEAEKSVQADNNSEASTVDGSQGAMNTPTSSIASIAGDSRPQSVHIPLVQVTPIPKATPSPKRPSAHAKYVEAEGDSSASPISDFEEMYSDDEHTLKPREAKKQVESDDEDKNKKSPWNAVCIVGLRAYSKDQELELLVWDEKLDMMARALNAAKKKGVEVLEKTSREEKADEADDEAGGEEKTNREIEVPKLPAVKKQGVTAALECEIAQGCELVACAKRSGQEKSELTAKEAEDGLSEIAKQLAELAKTFERQYWPVENGGKEGVVPDDGEKDALASGRQRSR
ncbi:hypothetical protein LZ554_000360 [Drepanopeziza brunnea f. sp. 'monogermtubi']|nr:hypothetical protein LZ554_000360 [Drepanopeziza brunnea f. sp. 'monogermtubi']